MKRSPLNRKSPMKRRSAAPMKQRALPKEHTSPYGGGVWLKKRTMRKRRPKATPMEQAHMDSVSRLGCIICAARDSHGRTSLHHIRTGYGTAERASHWEVLPLCSRCHQTGGFGIAFHGGPRTWQAKYGTEVALLVVVYERIGTSFDSIPELRGSTPPWWPRYLDGAALVSNAAEIFEGEPA